MEDPDLNSSSSFAGLKISGLKGSSTWGFQERRKPFRKKNLKKDPKIREAQTMRSQLPNKLDQKPPPAVPPAGAVAAPGAARDAFSPKVLTLGT